MAESPATDVLSGPEVCRLMRKHRVTIRRLAAIMRVPQRRVREVRLKGVSGRWTVWDWVSAIQELERLPPT